MMGSAWWIRIVAVLTKCLSNPKGTRVSCSRRYKTKQSLNLVESMSKGQGKHHNLQEIYDQVNKDYFDSGLNLPIAWFGRAGKSRGGRRLLGLYDHQKGLIKIHRQLDQPTFPPYYIRYVIYHEMLHHTHPPKRGARGRRKIHHHTFKEKEKQFREYAMAKKWEKDCLKMELFYGWTQ